MDGGLIITFISVAMFVGSFLLGFIPLLFQLSEVSDFLCLYPVRYRIGLSGSTSSCLICRALIMCKAVVLETC